MFDISKFRVVPDFPKKGIQFYDITTVMNDAEAFREAFNALLEAAKAVKPDVVVGLESRGYFFAPSLALALGLPFVPVRKAGKLPYKTYKATYHLEYGDESIEMHVDAMKPGQRVLVFDDILATGGTANATIELLKNFTPSFIATHFLMEIKALNGRARIPQEVNDIQCLLSV
ncbi:MAG: adenine phosphoribosyltransferase [Bacteroidales bacterium]|nr:adenine phosphoribosyltransferase [Bacteroidales bacterium]